MISAKRLIEARVASEPLLMSAKDAATAITKMLLNREGEILTKKVAVERANNIATALKGYIIK